MDLQRSRERVKKLRHYIDLGLKLEGLVEEEHRRGVILSRKELENTLHALENIVLINEKAIRAQAEAEGMRAELIHDSAKRLNIPYEKSRTRSEKQMEKSYGRKMFEDLTNCFENLFLSMLGAPFSRKESSVYANIARMYARTIKIEFNAFRINLETRKIVQKNLADRAEIEMAEARNYYQLISRGFDEKTAEEITFDSNYPIYQAFDKLGEHFGLDLKD